MRKAIIFVLVFLVLVASAVISSVAFAEDKITVREVVPEGIKLGMSFKEAIFRKLISAQIDLI